jgi:acyl-CoA reductase-like NAD-dependent aldehyde dehydrogenase
MPTICLSWLNISSEEMAVLRHLYTVAHTFIQVQQRREEADYDTGKEWTQTDVSKQIDAAAAAFKSWKAISEEPVAQAYLVSLLGKRSRSE